MATKRTTVFERWLERRRRERAPTEHLFANPLNARVGDHVAIDLPGWEDLNFEIISLRQVNMCIGDEEYPFTDYFLLARDIEGQEFNYGLRFVPLDQPDHAAGITHQVLLLTSLIEHEYREELEDALHNGRGVSYTIDGEDGREIEESWVSRVEDVELPYECTVSILEDHDHDGEVDRDEVEENTLVFWDFGRTQESEDGEAEVDYLFVEIEDSGFTTYRHATEIDQMVVRTL